MGKQKYGKGNPAKMKLDLSDDNNRRAVQESLMASYRWFDREISKTDEEVKERIIEFFEVCSTEGEIPTVEKLALAQGTTTDILRKWENGDLGIERSVLVKRAKQLIADYDAQMVAKGKMPPVAYIFRAKNYYGMADEQKHIVEPSKPLGELSDPEEIAERLEGAVVIEQEPDDEEDE